jgi:hypothetical protein
VSEARRLQTIVVSTDTQTTAFSRTSGWDEQRNRLRFTQG